MVVSVQEALVVESEFVILIDEVVCGRTRNRPDVDIMLGHRM